MGGFGSLRARALRAGVVASAAALAVAAYMAFVYAPEDALQGPVQRIFYFHVPSAIAAYMCFAFVLGGSAVYLWRRSERADRLARAAAPVGLVFTSTAWLMGMVWAKPIWNWDPGQTWDARITSTAVLWAVYAGYLLVRRFAPPESAPRLAAVVGIVGFVDVPVVHFSVQWWRTLHPGPVVDAVGGPALPAAMLLAFGVTVVAMLLFAGTLIGARYRLEGLREARAAAALGGEGAPGAAVPPGAAPGAAGAGAAPGRAGAGAAR